MIETNSLVADARESQHSGHREHFLRHSHDSVQVMHLLVVLRVVWVVARRIELVDFGLQRCVCGGIRKKTVEHADHGVGCCVGTSYDSKDGIANQTLLRRRRYVL